MNQLFSPRISVEQVEEGFQLAPKFDGNGLIPVVTTDVNTGEVLMHAYMNEEALVKTNLKTNARSHVILFSSTGQRK